MKLFYSIFILIVCSLNVAAQHSIADTTEYLKEWDIVDVYHWFRGNPLVRNAEDTFSLSRKLHISLVPAAGYTLQTGAAGIIAANAGFYTNKANLSQTKISTVSASLTYSQREQIIIPVLSSIWLKKNRYNIVGDWKFVKYPSYTYGLGGYTTLDDQYTIDYNAIRVHESILREITPNFYLGAGYAFDYFWNIEEDDPPQPQSDFQAYGFSETSLSSGITLHALYDDRLNAINAHRGNFLFITYRNNNSTIGSDNNWQSLQIDARKYIPFPSSSKNTLAFWSYNWLTLDGKPPYLMLPNTGSDPSSNFGRGYIQGRFRSRNILYLETEYRFNLTHNGLFGAVVFGNLQGVSSINTGKLEQLAPGYGFGLRIKLNKFSKTNLCIDYGFGADGSRGFFVNLGEVF
ncbi:MAG: hypothetical protein JST52_09015 [Bacteroidetes bacterium]|nr:hypothetical protein [Bacteroidota bacterium]MBS1741071.1 hypothetical protein [Bacteroidota bacterium]